jgi:hypothetical protein
LTFRTSAISGLDGRLWLGIEVDSVFVVEGFMALRAGKRLSAICLTVGHVRTRAHHGRDLLFCEYASSVPSIFTLVSATSARQITLHASEKAVSGFQCLFGSYITQRKYQRPPHVESRSMPVREQHPDSSISLDRTSPSGSINDLRLSSHAPCQ